MPSDSVRSDERRNVDSAETASRFSDEVLSLLLQPSSQERPEQPKEVNREDGSKLNFNDDGRLTSIQFRDNTTQQFEWDGDNLKSLKLRDGRWFDRQRSGDEFTDAWKARSGGGVWNGKVEVDQRTGTYSVTAESGNDKGVRFNFRTDDSKEIQQRDGTRQVVYPSKGSISYSKDGTVNQMVAPDGTVRTFGWQERDGKSELSSIQVRKPNGEQYNWLRKKDGWYVNGEKRDCDFEVDSKKGQYIYKNYGDFEITTHDPSTKEGFTTRGAEVTHENGLKHTRIGDRERVEGKFDCDGNTRTFDIRNGEVQTLTVKNEKGEVTGKWERVGKDRYKSGDKEHHIRFELNGNEYKITEPDLNKVTIRTPKGPLVEEYGTKDKTIAKYDGEKLTELTTPDAKFALQKDGSWKREGEDDGFERVGAPRLNKDGSFDFITKEGALLRQQVGEEAKEINTPGELTKKVATDERLDAAAKWRFIDNHRDFTNRSDLSAEEKTKTLTEIQRLFESTSDAPFNANQKAQLAEQLMWHVAHPELDAQGNVPNCSVTDVRICLERQQPSAFAKMIADVTTTGEYVSSSGHRIKPNAQSFEPGKQEQSYPTDGMRSWVGKISDVTMANIHWQRRIVDTNGNGVAVGTMAYEEVRPTSQSDAGIRVVRYDRQSDGRLHRQEVEHKISLHGENIMDIYSQITGADEKGRYLAHTSRRGGKNVSSISSVEQLEEALAKGPYPKIAQLQNNVLYGRQSDGKDHEHVVVITGYDPQTKKLRIDNSGQSASDLLADDKQITTARLFEAMQTMPPRPVQQNVYQGYYYNGVYYYSQPHMNGRWHNGIYYPRRGR